jgi:Spy/CpxP family protein refolding chaperone
VKNSIWVLVVLLFAGYVAAQPPPPPPPPQDPIGEHLFPPELVMANQRAIGLDDAQKLFLRAELVKAQTKFTETQFQLQDNMEALVILLRQSPSDEVKVLEQLDKVLNLEREMKRAQIGLMVRIKNKLTPEQQAKLRQIRVEPRPRPE